MAEMYSPSWAGCSQFSLNSNHSFSKLKLRSRSPGMSDPLYHLIYHLQHSNIGVINEVIILRQMESGLDNCRFNRGYELQSPLLRVRALEALANPDCGWFYRVNAETFEAAPSSPIAYWMNKRIWEAYEKGVTFADVGHPKVGMQTSNNDKYLRLWWEINRSECFQMKCRRIGSNT